MTSTRDDGIRDSSPERPAPVGVLAGWFGISAADASRAGCPGIGVARCPPESVSQGNRNPPCLA